MIVFVKHRPLENDMASTAEVAALKVGLLATMPDNSLRFAGEDGQVQAIVASASFQILREEAKIDIEGSSPEVREKLSQLHNRVVMIDTKRSDPREKLKAQIIDHILGVIKEAEVVRAVYMREHFGHGIGENLEFEQALTYAFADISAIITSAEANNTTPERRGPLTRSGVLFVLTA